MKRLFAIILTLFATSAFAVGIGNDNPPGGGGTYTPNSDGKDQCPGGV